MGITYFKNNKNIALEFSKNNMYDLKIQDLKTIVFLKHWGKKLECLQFIISRY